MTDAKEDWAAIPVEQERRCNISLAFLDAEAMRFHLPAFLIADLRGQYGYGMAFWLTRSGDCGRNQFAALSPPQRTAVRRFLEHILEDPDYEPERDSIRRALEGLWLPGPGMPGVDPDRVTVHEEAAR